MSETAGQDGITIEVVYGEPDRQALVSIDLPRGATVADAIEASGLESEFPDMIADPDMVGIFGRKVPVDQRLESGDRVEIYRPLKADPKAVRRARAEAEKRS